MGKAHMVALAKEALAELDAAKRQYSAIADSPQTVVLAKRVKRQREEALAKARHERAQHPKARRALSFKALGA